MKQVHEQINSNGKAYDGRRGPVVVAIASIVFIIVVCVGTLF